LKRLIWPALGYLYVVLYTNTNTNKRHLHLRPLRLSF